LRCGISNESRRDFTISLQRPGQQGLRKRMLCGIVGGKIYHVNSGINGADLYGAQGNKY